MSLLVKKGSFAFPDSGSNLPVTGVGFQPKVVIFWLTKQSAVGFAAEKYLAVGWAVSSSQRGFLGLQSGDAKTDGLSIGNMIRTDFCIKAFDTVSGSVSTVLDADFVSMDSDGFTINPGSVSAGKLYIVHYLALGGTELTNAFAGSFNSPTATGNQAYTGVGFQPDCLLFLTNATGTIPRSDTGHKMSFGATDGVNSAVAYIGEQNAVPTNCRTLQETGKVIHTLSFAGADNVVAALTSVDSDGFTLNFSTVQADARGFLVLALKGPLFKVLTDTQKTSTGTQAKTGVGFSPLGLLLWGTNRASPSTPDATLASLSIGASDGSIEGSSWVGSVDNVSTTDENSATSTSKVLQHATGPSTLNAEADLASLDPGGYTLNWTTADAVAREFIGLAIGSPLSGGVLLQPSADSVDGTWTDDAGGTALSAAIDESAASDTDYIKSVASPSNAGCRVKLTAGTDPASSSGHVINWRVRKDAPGGQQIDMTVKLYQGGGSSLGAGTLIASFTRTNVDGSAWTTYSETLSGAQADSITDYADLYLEFYANAP